MILYNTIIIYCIGHYSTKSQHSWSTCKFSSLLSVHVLIPPLEEFGSWSNIHITYLLSLRTTRIIRSSNIYVFHVFIMSSWCLLYNAMVRSCLVSHLAGFFNFSIQVGTSHPELFITFAILKHKTRSVLIIIVTREMCLLNWISNQTFWMIISYLRTLIYSVIYLMWSKHPQQTHNVLRTFMANSSPVLYLRKFVASSSVKNVIAFPGLPARPVLPVNKTL